MTPTAPITHLICEEVSFRYRRSTTWVLEAFSHRFAPGITLISGASGCGKSTLLRLLGGYLRPAKGRIIAPPGIDPGNVCFQRRELGFVFQQLNLLPLASIARNLELAGSLSGLEPAAARERAARWLSLLGLEKDAARQPGALSTGQQQRAAIARALVKEPRVLLLDEPTSGLDDLNTGVIIRALQGWIQGGRICVICSHDHRLDLLAHEVLDFNRFLPLEGHLVSLAGAAE